MPNRTASAVGALRAALFLLSSFGSALLLFLVEPMVAKMALPWFGGGPAIWNTCLVTFQALLLAGYAYAHFSSSRLRPRAQIALHLVVLAAPLALLPPAIAARWAPPPGAWPVPHLLGALVVAVGPAFFALATNATLAQRWFSLVGEREPWWLYAASNAGSLAALALYPLVVERRLGLGAQGRLFAAGYAAFALLTLACLLATRRALVAAAPAQPSDKIRVPVDNKQRARWVFRAGVTSLALCAVSLRIATDVASVPLLWTVPLALYLLSYILAFLPRLPYPRALLELLALVAFTVGAGLFPWTTSARLSLVLGAPLAALLLGSWVVHADLARDLPPRERLTDFYLATAAGGALGGVLANLIAPLVFSTVAEYPIALTLLALALAMGRDQGASLWRGLRRPLTWVGPIVVAGALVITALSLRWGPQEARIAYRAVPVTTLVAAIVLRRVPGFYAIAFALASLCATLGLDGSPPVRARHRDFFGVMRVVESDGGRRLMHGTTMHGSQQIQPFSREPTAYYHPATPMGATMRAAPDGARVAVVGLGTGSLAALARPGQTLTYYELDPAVEPIARRWFTYLDDARAPVSIVLGDARLTLARAAPASYDLLIVDAFSSDAIPVHLLTVEAVAMYLDKLAPGGVVLLHVSHRHLRLAPVLAGAAARLHVAVARNAFVPSEKEHDEGASSSEVIAIARKPEDLDRLGKRWRPLPTADRVVWTDDRSSLLDVLRR